MAVKNAHRQMAVDGLGLGALDMLKIWRPMAPGAAHPWPHGEEKGTFHKMVQCMYIIYHIDIIIYLYYVLPKLWEHDPSIAPCH